MKIESSETRESIIDDARKEGCLLCPEKDPCCLVFHHLDPEAKRFGIGRSRTMPKLFLAEIKAELRKCVCLCWNCHRKVHAQRPGYAHLLQPDTQPKPVPESTEDTDEYYSQFEPNDTTLVRYRKNTRAIRKGQEKKKC